MKLFKNYKFYLIVIVLFSTVVRFAWLDNFPPSLYTDEANQGYNAYSVLLTRKDEHGKFLPVSFRSFGDWKPPLPTYLMIPFVFLFGLNEVSVRLPSVILSIGTIIVNFYLVREIFAKRKFSLKLALVSSFLLSISPWHILQSRAAMLVMISLFFLITGVFLFIKSNVNSKLIIFSCAFFVLSIYSYYGMRVVTPIIVIYLAYSYRRTIISRYKDSLIGVILGLVLLSPLLFAYLKYPDVLLGRARTVSIFYDQGIKLRQWELITQDEMHNLPVISRLFHNSIYMYGRDVVNRFLSHFSGDFLLVAGDQSPPFQIPNMGILYLLDGIFILLGLIFLLRNRAEGKIILFVWLLASILPAAFTFMTPSSNRTFSAVFPFMVFVSMGLIWLVKKTKRHIFTSLGISIIYAVSFFYFLSAYFVILPTNHADWWNYGWREVVLYVQKNEKKYQNIVVSDSYGMPYIYFLFYGKYSPAKFQNEAIRTYVADRFGFEHVEGFGKYVFLDNLDWETVKKDPLEKALYIIPSKQAEFDNDYIYSVNYPNGKAVIKIFPYDKKK